MFLDKPFAVTAASVAAPSPSLIGGLDLSALVAALWRRKFYLAMCGLLGALAVVAVAAALPHRYQATAEILVDPRDLKMLDKEVTPQTIATDSGITVVESQVAVLSSNSVLKRAIEKLDLETDSEFNGKDENVLTRAVSALSNLVTSARHVAAETATLQSLKQRVTVVRPERTFIIQLTVTTRDPDKSIRIADAIVAAYLEDQAQFRSSSNEGAAEAIDAGLDNMKSQVNAAEQKVASYKAAHNLGLASGRLLAEQQLTDANNQLAQAHAETNRIKAQLEDVQASRGRPESIPEIVGSQSLINLKKQLNVVSAERARLAAQLMPKHPALITLEGQERQVRADLDQEIARILTSISHDYERAKANEESLTHSVERLQAEMNESDVAQIELRELQRDLDSRRSLYEQSVARARETREQSRLNTSNVRVISSATAAPTRSFPPRNVILMPLGFLLGLALGGGLTTLKLIRGGSTARPSSTHSRARVRSASAPSVFDSFRKNIVGIIEAATSPKSTITPETNESSPPQDAARLPAARLAKTLGNRGLAEEKRPDPKLKLVAVDALADLDLPRSKSGEGPTASEPPAGRRNRPKIIVADNIPGAPAHSAPETNGANRRLSSVGNDNTNPFPPVAAAETPAPHRPEPIIVDMRQLAGLVQTAARPGGGPAMHALAKSILTSPHGAFARHIRTLRTALIDSRSSTTQAGARIVAFLSNGSIAIKPAVIEALARSFAAANQKVLIVDAESYGPATRPLASELSLPSILPKGAPRAQIVHTREPLLDMLSLSGQPPRDSIEKLAKDTSYDFILIGAEPSSPVSMLGESSDAIAFYAGSAGKQKDLDSDLEALRGRIPGLRGVILNSKQPVAAAAHVAS